MLSEYLKNITQKGIVTGMNASDEKRVIITNYILLIASLVAFGRVFMFFYSGDFSYSSISLAATVFFLFAYFMNTKGHYDFAKFFLIIIGNAATLYKEISSGGNGNQIALIIAGFMVVFLLFGTEEKRKLITALTIQGINFIVSVFFAHLIYSGVNITTDASYIDKVFGALSAVVITVLVTWYFVKKSADAESKLIKSNELLQNLYDEIYLQKEKIEELLKKSDKLLLNILPEPIALRLKEGETHIADHFHEASIIFIDIVNFTKISSNSTPESIVKELNKIFTKLDHISQKYDIEKIKTIGDCYMAAAGVPEARKDHIESISMMATEVVEVMKDYRTENGFDIRFRIGLDCGPVVAGVIGEQKFIYDLWGPPVNTASRLESSGVPGKIQVTERFKKALEDHHTIDSSQFKFEDRGEIQVRGIGKMRTFFMVNEGNL